MRRTPLASAAGASPTSPRESLRPSPRRGVRILLPVAVAGAVVALTGCQTQSPIQTDTPYQAADGVPVDLGPVQIRDLVVVSDGKDKPGVLTGSLINTSDSEQRIAFAAPNSQPVYATAAAHSQARLSDTSQLQMSSVPVAPGDVITLTVQSPSAPAAVVTVPVLPPAHYYQTVSPTVAPTTAPATATP